MVIRPARLQAIQGLLLRNWLVLKICRDVWSVVSKLVIVRLSLASQRPRIRVPCMFARSRCSIASTRLIRPSSLRGHWWMPARRSPYSYLSVLIHTSNNCVHLGKCPSQVSTCAITLPSIAVSASQRPRSMYPTTRFLLYIVIATNV